MERYDTDIVIIGAGPVGLFTIFEAGMLGMKVHVVDILDFVGGQCNALYPEKPIYDIPAYPKIYAQDLIKQLQIQAEPFSPVYHLAQLVEKLEKTKENTFLVTTSKNTQIHAKAVVIAAGSGSFGPNRPPLENIQEFEGNSVFYMVKSKKNFIGKKIVIAGGGDSAIDWALSLADISDRLYLVHRRNRFKCAVESMNQLKKLEQANKIELIVPYQLHKLQGKNGLLEEVQVIDLENNVRKIEADILLPFFGLSTNLGPINKFGLQLSKSCIEVNYQTMQTNIQGVFAVGDVATYPGKLKLILTGFSEAAIAAHNAYSYVNNGKELHFEYSTSKGVKL